MTAGLPFDLAEVNWLYVIILAFFVFVAALIGGVLSWQSRVTAAGMAAILFAVFFIAWSYYPHGVPLPTRLGPAVAPVVAPPPVSAPAAPAAPAAPVKPANPVRDITPPRNPVTDVTPQR